MKKYIIILLIAAIFFNGFSNLREITDIAIVKAIGLDKDEDGNFVATTIIDDTSKEEKLDGGIIYTSTGKTVQEALRNVIGKSPKKLYGAHMETLVISQDIAKEDFQNTMDFYIRDNEGSNAFYLFVAKDSSAKDIITCLNDEKISMKDLLYSCARYKGNCNTKTLNDIIRDELKRDVEMVVNVVSIEDNVVKIDNMAYFKEWEYSGILDNKEAIAYNILTNNLKSSMIKCLDGDDYIIADIISSKTKMNVDKEDNININIKLKTNITQTGNNVYIHDYSDVKKCEEKLSESVEHDINNLIYNTQNNYDCDIIGFGNLLYRKKSKLYNDEDYLKKLKVNVKVDVDTNVNVINQEGDDRRW